VRSHGQYCPVAKAAETLGDRWSLLLVRELLYGVSGFNEFERNLPGISRSVLAERLRRLERSGVVQRNVDHNGRTAGYFLTPEGRELDHVVQVLGDWAARWVLRDPQPLELDPDLVMLWISRHINVDRLPPSRVVVEFALSGCARRYWLVLQPDEVSLCLRHPGFDPDLVFSADLETLYRVYMGRVLLTEALQMQTVRIDGPPSLVRQAPRWFAWSSFAPAARHPAHEVSSSARV
jgi:DNA-binding HxlR family transcriptional regulator